MGCRHPQLIGDFRDLEWPILSHNPNHMLIDGCQLILESIRIDRYECRARSYTSMVPVVTVRTQRNQIHRGVATTIRLRRPVVEVQLLTLTRLLPAEQTPTAAIASSASTSPL